VRLVTCTSRLKSMLTLCIQTQTELSVAVKYGKSRKSRGLDCNRWGPHSRTRFVDSVFNRFGVGLLDAAFGLGDGKTTNMYIMTKTIDAPDVIQVALEAENILKKRDAGQRWDQYPKWNRGVGHISGASQIPPKLNSYQTIQELVNREKTDECFTTIVVDGVLPQLAEQFKERNESGKSQLADDLGHAYSYFFTVEDSAQDLQETRTLRRQPTRHSSDIATVSRPLCLSIDSEKEKPLQLRLKLPSSAQLGEDFIDVSADNLEERFELAGRNSRWFFISYTPELLSGPEGSGTTIVKITTEPHNNQLGTVRKYNRATSEYTVDVNGQLALVQERYLKIQPLVALGVLRYYPSRDFKETHPMAYCNSDGPQILPERQVECRFQGQPLFKENQKMRSLPFASLKGRQKLGTYGTDKLPEKCGSRWRATIFHDGRWPVGNNKLEMSLEHYSEKLHKANFSTFMTKEEIVRCQWYEQWLKPVYQGGMGGWLESWNRKGMDTQPRQDFRKWLLESHKLDKDIEYRDTDLVNGPEKRQIVAQFEPAHQQQDCFKAIVLSDERKFVANDKFCFHDAKAIVYAAVVAFCKDGGEDLQDGGTIYYRQLPAEFYPKLKQMPLKRLVIDQEKLKFCTFASDLSHEEKYATYRTNSMARIPAQFKITVKNWTHWQKPGIDVIETLAGGKPYEFLTDVCSQDGKSLNELGKKKKKKKKKGVKFGAISMKVRVVSSSWLDTAEEAPDKGTQYAFLDNTGQPASGSWNDLWATGCADVGDWVTAPETPKVAGLYALYFQCIFDTEETRRAVSEQRPLPTPDGFEHLTLRQFINVKPGPPERLHFTEEPLGDEDMDFKPDGMFSRGIRVGSEDSEEIALVLSDKYDNDIKIDHSILQGLVIQATATLKKGPYTLHKHLDQSRGLDIRSGELLLTLSWDWPDDNVWEQQVFNAMKKPVGFKVTLTTTLSGRPLQKFEFDRYTVKLWPRVPTALLVNFPKVITVDEDLDATFSVNFVDANGEIAAQMPDEVWKLNAFLKLGKSDIRFPLATNALYANLQGKIFNGWTSLCKQTRFRELVKQQPSLQATLQIDAVDTAVTWTDDVLVQHSQAPTSATVCAGTSENEATVVADETCLKGLIVRLRNAQGSEVPWDDRGVSNFQWNGQKLEDQDVFSGALPAIDLRSDTASKVGKRTYQGNITVGGEDLKLQFVINVVAGEAVKLQIEPYSDRPVPCSVEGKLAEVFAVQVVDQHRNVIDLDSVAETLSLSIQCRSKGVELQNGEFICAGNEFRLNKLAYLTGTLEAGETKKDICLRVLDLSRTFQYKDVHLTFAAGQAAGIRVEPHNLLDDPHGKCAAEGWTYTATVPQSYHLPPLKAKVVDVCGNKVLKKYSLKLTAEGSVRMHAIKGRWSDETNLVEFTPHSDDDKIESEGTDDSYYLEISCTQIAHSARIKCTVVLSNKVTDVVAEPLRPQQVVAGAQFSVPLVLTLHTEDGNAPAVAKTCFSVQLIYGESTQAIGVVAVDEDKVIVKSWQGIDGSPYVPTQAGKYQLVYTFKDSRPVDSAIIDKDLIVDVVGGQASILTLLSSAEDAVTNGGAADDRILIKNPLLQVKDQHGNPTSTSGQVVVSLRVEDGQEVADALEGVTTSTVDESGSVSFRDCDALRLREGVGGDLPMQIYLKFVVDGVGVNSELIYFTPHQQIVVQTQVALDVRRKISTSKEQLKVAVAQLKQLEERLKDEQQQVQNQIQVVDVKFADAAALLTAASIEYIEELQDIEHIHVVQQR
jgi:hypothetical protein